MSGNKSSQISSGSGVGPSLATCHFSRARPAQARSTGSGPRAKSWGTGPTSKRRKLFARHGLGITRPTSRRSFRRPRHHPPWSGSRFGKLKVPSLSRDDPAAVCPRARSLALQLVATHRPACPLLRSFAAICFVRPVAAHPLQEIRGFICRGSDTLNLVDDRERSRTVYRERSRTVYRERSRTASAWS